MRDFSYLAPRSTNDKILDSAKVIFEKQMQSLEGADLIIDGNAVRGIVYNHLNDMSESKEDRALNVPMEVNIGRGSYVDYKNETYIAVSDIDDHFVYRSCKMSKCTQKLKWVGVPTNFQEGFPCIMDNEGGTSKLISDNEHLSKANNQVKIVTQYNQYTKNIKKDWRFIFNKSENDIFKIIDITFSMKNGLIVMTAIKDIRLAEDDLENNLAFQKKEDLETVNTVYSILGDTYIKFEKTKEFKIEPSCDNLTWEVDNSKAEIVSSGNNSCVIKAIKRNAVVKLIAKANGTKIASMFAEVQ